MIIGAALAVYTGLTSTQQTLGGVIALGLVGFADGVISYLDLRSTSVAVVPARSGGAPEQPPTVRARHTKGRTTVQVRLHELTLWGLKHPYTALKPGGSQVLSWRGTHPIAAIQIAWDLTTNRVGLCSASQSHYKSTSSLVFRGPARPEKPVDLPTVTSREDLSILREYVPGDRMSRVNWAATARTTTLHVRDVGGSDDEIVIVLVICPVANTYSREALIAAITLALVETRSLGEQILALGRPLRLVTTEAPETQAKLAQAQARTIQPKLPAPGQADHFIVVDAAVTDDYELLRRLAITEPAFDEPSVHGPHIRVSLDGIEVR